MNEKEKTVKNVIVEEFFNSKGDTIELGFDEQDNLIVNTVIVRNK